MSLAVQVSSLATRMGTEAKALRTLINNNAADLTGLSTTAQGNLVAAINEVLGIAQAAAGGGVSINDAATNTTQAWSSSKINTEIGTQTAAAVNAAIDGAPAALDTLNELAAAVGDDANFSATVTTALGNRIRYDSAQTLTAPQQLQACQNIGVGDPETDFVAVFNAALV